MRPVTVCGSEIIVGMPQTYAASFSLSSTEAARSFLISLLTKGGVRFRPWPDSMSIHAISSHDPALYRRRPHTTIHQVSVPNFYKSQWGGESETFFMMSGPPDSDIPSPGVRIQCGYQHLNIQTRTTYRSRFGHWGDWDCDASRFLC